MAASRSDKIQFTFWVCYSTTRQGLPETVDCMWKDLLAHKDDQGLSDWDLSVDKVPAHDGPDSDVVSLVWFSYVCRHKTMTLSNVDAARLVYNKGWRNVRDLLKMLNTSRSRHAGKIFRTQYYPKNLSTWTFSLGLGAWYSCHHHQGPKDATSSPELAIAEFGFNYSGKTVSNARTSPILSLPEASRAVFGDKPTYTQYHTLSYRLSPKQADVDALVSMLSQRSASHWRLFECLKSLAQDSTENGMASQVKRAMWVSNHTNAGEWNKVRTFVADPKGYGYTTMVRPEDLDGPKADVMTFTWDQTSLAGTVSSRVIHQTQKAQKTGLSKLVANFRSDRVLSPAKYKRFMHSLRLDAVGMKHDFGILETAINQLEAKTHMYCCYVDEVILNCHIQTKFPELQSILQRPGADLKKLNGLINFNLNHLHRGSDRQKILRNSVNWMRKEENAIWWAEKPIACFMESLQSRMKRFWNNYDNFLIKHAAGTSRMDKMMTQKEKTLENDWSSEKSW